MLKLLLNFFGGSVLEKISNDLSRAYLAKLDADTDEKRLSADIVIQELTAHRELLMKEQDRAMTAWVRPAFASLIFLLWAKLIVWDTMLGWGVTVLPQTVEWIAILIPSVYFLMRPSEKTGEGILKQLSGILSR